MATKKDPDQVKAYVVLEINVSETKWREYCAAQGIDLRQTNVAAHIGTSVRALSYSQLATMGFPQESQ